jgi:hypothetical protein
MNHTRTLSVPEELCRKAEQKFSARFGGVEELVAALLTELLRDDALALDEREQQIIEERLKGLGYV